MLASLLGIQLPREWMPVQKLHLRLPVSLHPSEKCDRCQGMREIVWDRGVLVLKIGEQGSPLARQAPMRPKPSFLIEVPR